MSARWPIDDLPPHPEAAHAASDIDDAPPPSDAGYLLAVWLTRAVGAAFAVWVVLALTGVWQ